MTQGVSSPLKKLVEGRKVKLQCCNRKKQESWNWWEDCCREIGR